MDYNNKDILVIIKKKPQMVLNTQLGNLNFENKYIIIDYTARIKECLNNELINLPLTIFNIDVRIVKENLTITAIFNEPINQELYKKLFTEILKIDYIKPIKRKTILFYKDKGNICETHTFTDEDWKKIIDFRKESVKL